MKGNSNFNSLIFEKRFKRNNINYYMIDRLRLSQGEGLMLKQLQKIEKIDHECVELMRIAKEMGISIQDIREFLGMAYISK